MKWLDDEREARSYLHSLANKMHDELDSMKTATIRRSDWQHRRHQVIPFSSLQRPESCYGMDKHGKNLQNSFGVVRAEGRAKVGLK